LAWNHDNVSEWADKSICDNVSEWADKSICDNVSEWADMSIHGLLFQ